MAIKRNITDVSTLKRGANTLSAVYRGTTLIWPTTPPPSEPYIINSWNVENPYYWYEQATSENSIQTIKIMEFFKL